MAYCYATVYLYCHRCKRECNTVSNLFFLKEIYLKKQTRFDENWKTCSYAKITCCLAAEKREWSQRNFSQSDLQNAGCETF